MSWYQNDSGSSVKKAPIEAAYGRLHLPLVRHGTRPGKAP